MDLFFVVLGLIILLFAGDSLVRGAVNLALRLGIPALIVSLTIVAFGTSAPELLVSISAILDDAPGLALGNVVGSNIANILLVLGIPAVISGLTAGGEDTKKSYLQMLAATMVFVAVCFFGEIGRAQALILLCVLTVFLVSAVRDGQKHRHDNQQVCAQEIEGADPDIAWWKICSCLIIGLIGLPVGADLLVDSATNIARHYGVSETVIGLSLVAIGTSLPELATTVMAAMRKQSDVAIGNVIGSNIFNLLAIIGISAMVGPIPVDPSFLRMDLWIMVGASLCLAPFVLKNWPMGRLWGILFSVVYLAYILSILGMS